MKKTENINHLKFNTDEYLFHAGTTQKNNKVYAIGGRVLNFVALANSFLEAKEKINKNLNNLNWSGGFYRKDIGYKVID